MANKIARNQARTKIANVSVSRDLVGEENNSSVFAKNAKKKKKTQEKL